MSNLRQDHFTYKTSVSYYISNCNLSGTGFTCEVLNKPSCKAEDLPARLRLPLSSIGFSLSAPGSYYLYYPCGASPSHVSALETFRFPEFPFQYADDAEDRRSRHNRIYLASVECCIKSMPAGLPCTRETWILYAPFPHHSHLGTLA